MTARASTAVSPQPGRSKLEGKPSAPQLRIFPPNPLKYSAYNLFATSTFKEAWETMKVFKARSLLALKSQDSVIKEKEKN